MSFKSWVDAQRHKGGVVKYLYDVVKSMGTTVGDSDSGLVKDVAGLKTDVGASDTSANSLKKRCKTIETAIGTETTEGSILYRIKQLENANNGGGSQ